MTSEEELYLVAIINANRHQKLHELGHLIKGTPAGTASASRTKDGVNNKKGVRKGLVSYPDHNSHSRYLHRRRQSLS